ncbi:uncharacterized protein RCH25_036491 [Pelodytes ibericus]
MGTVSAVWMITLTALVLLLAVPGESKVYYLCGAVLDSTEKGLILSPGFPNNYLPGSHCVWQFFIPAGSRLMIETLDFDVFEASSDDEIPFVAAYSEFTTLHEIEKDIKYSAAQTEASLLIRPEIVTERTTTDHISSPNEINKDIVIPRKSLGGMGKGEKRLIAFQGVTEEKNVLNNEAGILQKDTVTTVLVSEDRKDSNKPAHLLDPFTASMQEHFEGYWQQLNEDGTASPLMVDIATDPSTSPSSLFDVCPYDVLYISDLTTFSTRFCGSNSPLNNMLVFGSPVEMTEVIMELITTTNRGRGFAVLFSYQNQTSVTAMGVVERQSKEDVMLLAVTSATISFALVLLLVLCLSYRQKMCPKRDHPEQVTPQLTGTQNAALEVSELQRVTTGEDLSRELESASEDEKAADLSVQTLQDDPSTSIATATSDEVFVISDSSNKERFSFTHYPKECILKRCVTSPASVSDWLNSDYTSVDLSADDNGTESMEVDPARLRTWSIRTFNSLLPPIPQLQVKWSNRLSSGSFTKLVDSGCTVPPRLPSPRNPRRAGSAVQIDGNSSCLYSESSESNASYPLTHSAQLNRRLPSCNLKRTRPYFGFLNGSSEGPRSSTLRSSSSKENHVCQNSGMEFPSAAKSSMPSLPRTKDVDMEKPKTVFVISEEADDQQPLVLDDQLSPSREMHAATNGISSSSCNENVHSEDFTRDGSELHPWMKTPDNYRYQYKKKMPSFKLDGDRSNLSKSSNSINYSELDANVPFTKMGLATE